MNRAFVSEQRFRLVVVCVLIGFNVLIGRLVYLHVYMQKPYAQIAEQNRKRFQPLESRRGDILDRNQQLLATSRQVRELGVDPHQVRQEDLRLLEQLAALLNQPVDQLSECFAKKYYSDGRAIRWRKLADALDEDLYEKIMELGIRGLYGNAKFTRYYPGGSLAAHVIGYINNEGTKGRAVMGVEQFLDFYLTGQDGWRELERDGRRREIVEFRQREVSPTDGYHVQLTLDLSIQHFVEAELNYLAELYQPESVSIIVSEPSTGAVLAMGNYPTFDLNAYGKCSLDSQRNRALTDIYEPGSTFKIVSVAGVLNERLIHPSETIDCSEPIAEYRGRKLRLPRDHHDLGKLSVEEILVKSSNRGAAHLGLLLGEQQLYQYARLFGFGSETQLGLSGEVVGILHPVNDWDGLMITRIPMGHAVSATPLQVHQAMSVIANRGLAMKPQIVSAIYNKAGDVVHTFMPRPVKQVISIDTAQWIAEMLHKVVGPEGTAGKAAIKGYSIAGKTGTTQKLINGHYSSDHHVASFVGFFPHENPRLLITVVVDEPKDSGKAYGGQIAAPAFKRIAQKCIGYLNIPPETSSLVIADRRKAARMRSGIIGFDEMYDGNF